MSEAQTFFVPLNNMTFLTGLAVLMESAVSSTVLVLGLQHFQFCLRHPPLYCSVLGYP
jgi:hypothetical protein